MIVICKCMNIPLSPSLFFQGETRLHGAAERGDVQAVKQLINTSININARTEEVSLSIIYMQSILLQLVTLTWRVNNVSVYVKTNHTMSAKFILRYGRS